jgi:aflatoxin B1 aldehyde reductase
MAFYAYSPLGGGFFSRPYEELTAPPEGGRMKQMPVFQSMYVNDLSLKLNANLTQACKAEGIAVKAATLRWLLHHSPLGAEDGIILGASSEEQMEENLQACESGNLPESVVASFEEMGKEYRASGKADRYWV